MHTQRYKPVHYLRLQVLKATHVRRSATHITSMSEKPITLYTAGTPNGWKVRGQVLFVKQGHC